MTFEQLIVFLSGPAFAVWASHLLDLLPAGVWHNQATATKLLVSTVLTALAGYVATLLPQLIPSTVVTEYDALFKAVTVLIAVVAATIYHVWQGRQAAKTSITATSDGGTVSATASPAPVAGAKA